MLKYLYILYMHSCTEMQGVPLLPLSKKVMCPKVARGAELLPTVQIHACYVN